MQKLVVTEASSNLIFPKVKNDFQLSEFHVGLQESVIPWRVNYASEIPSTMAITDFLSAGGMSPRSGDLLIAGNQTSGVGIRGSWLSQSEDIKLTFLLDQPVAKDLYFIKKIAVGLAVIETVQEVSGRADLPLCFKWPNDVYFHSDTEWRKVSGIIVSSAHDSYTRQILEEKGFQIPTDLMVIGIGVCLKKPDAATQVVKDGNQIALSAIGISVEEIVGQLMPRDKTIGVMMRHLETFLHLAENNLQSFLEKATKKMALGPDNTVTLERLDGQISNERFADIRKEGIYFRNVESNQLTLHYFEEIKRISPQGLPNW